MGRPCKLSKVWLTNVEGFWKLKQIKMMYTIAVVKAVQGGEISPAIPTPPPPGNPMLKKGFASVPSMMTLR